MYSKLKDAYPKCTVSKEYFQGAFSLYGSLKNAPRRFMPDNTCPCRQLTDGTVVNGDFPRQICGDCRINPDEKNKN